MRHPLDQLPALGHDLLRSDPDVPPLSRRAPAHPHRGEVLELHQGSPQEHTGEISALCDDLCEGVLLRADTLLYFNAVDGIL